ncbi:MAG TPA: helicase-related protein [Polyangiaceae bacterium]|nr:helicase-related protein [Polyangiaceae bacterium]
MPVSEATQSTLLLGPTNTGKTHRAVERMLSHDSGMIGLPLRLLAREVYDRIAGRLGEDRVALVTGEEKRLPRRPSYWVCTTEAMPLTRDVDFVAVDEVQLATHDERGHVFSDRLLHARGRKETWFLGSSTMRGVLSQIVPAARLQEHPRLSRLSFAGTTKLSRLKPRTALVGFSMRELYELAGRLCALRGGTALVLGALSPRARNAQVAMFQSGEVDYLVATDAIGMGLNLAVEHVAFASLRKFDGHRPRALSPAELAQIAGRAGRYLQDGTFGTIAPLELPLDVARSLEAQSFEPVRSLRYRNHDLDFSSAAELLASLKAPPKLSCFTSAPHAEDLRVLEALVQDPELTPLLAAKGRVELLWHVCQVPDFRNLLFEVHIDLLKGLFVRLCEGPLPRDFMYAQIEELERFDGDPDALMARIARLRTWAFVAHQSEFVRDASMFQAALANLEDRLSDALHAALVDRFVARRGSNKIRRTLKGTPRTGVPGSTLNGNAPPTVDESNGELAFRPFAALSGLRAQLGPVEVEPQLSPTELLSSTLLPLVDAPHEAFRLDERGRIWAGQTELARLTRGSSLALPDVRLIELPQIGGGLRAQLQRRLIAYVRDVSSRLVGEAHALADHQDRLLRALYYQLHTGLGVVLLKNSGLPIPQLRAGLKTTGLDRHGLRFGQLAVWISGGFTPARYVERRALLSAQTPEIAAPGSWLPDTLGRPSYVASARHAPQWLALGYVVLGDRALRLDLAEKVAHNLHAHAQNTSDEQTQARSPRTPPQAHAAQQLGSFGVPARERGRALHALRGLVPPAVSLTT